MIRATAEVSNPQHFRRFCRLGFRILAI